MYKLSERSRRLPITSRLFDATVLGRIGVAFDKNGWSVELRQAITCNCGSFYICNHLGFSLTVVIWIDTVVVHLLPFRILSRRIPCKSHLTLHPQFYSTLPTANLNHIPHHNLPHQRRIQILPNLHHLPCLPIKNQNPTIPTYQTSAPSAHLTLSPLPLHHNPPQKTHLLS